MKGSEADERKRKGTEKPEVERWKEHLWNGCGSEAGKGKRKQTAALSTGNRKAAWETRLKRKGKTGIREENRAASKHCEASL